MSDERDILGTAYDPHLMRRLLGELRPFWGRIGLALVFMFLASAANVAGPVFIQRAVDDALVHQNGRLLLIYVGLFLGAALVEWWATRARIAIMAVVGTRLVCDIRERLFAHLHTLSLNFYNKFAIGRLMSRLINDVGVLQDFVTWAILGVFRDIFLLAGTVLAMLALNWQLSLAAFATMPIMVWATRVWRRQVREAYRTVRQRIAVLNGYLNESITGIRVTKAFVREARNIAHFDELNRAHFRANERAGWLAAVFFPAVDMLSAVSLVLVIGYGGMRVLGGSLTPGVLIAFALYVERFFNPIRDLAQRYNTFQSAMVASERIYQLLDTQPDLRDAPDAIELPPIKGRVEFDHVWFAYGARWYSSSPAFSMSRMAPFALTATMCAKSPAPVCAAKWVSCCKLPSCSAAPCARTFATVAWTPPMRKWKRRRVRWGRTPSSKNCPRGTRPRWAKTAST